MADIEHCPTCGQRVTVVSSDEGTSHYSGVAEAEVERLGAERDRAVETRENANAVSIRADAEVERLREALQYIADWQLGEAMAARLMRDHARSVLDG